MRRLFAVALALGFTVSAVAAPTVLNVSVQSGGANAVDVTPGQVVDYQVMGQLQDLTNQGLALFAFTLSYDCGDLAQASPPSEAETPGITECLPANNLGLTNPAGFGGTTNVPGQLGDLVQIGCAFNTILNTNAFAPFPLGAVVLGIGQTQTVLAKGQLTIPADATNGQVCTLMVSGVFGNTIMEGEVSDGTHWAVEGTGEGSKQNLVMTVGTAVQPALASSAPGCGVSLTRPSNSVVRLTFSAPIPDPVTSADLEIFQITDGGGMGADISGQFTYTVEGGNVLRIAENGTAAFTSGLWYAIANTGNWTGVANFEVDYRVVHGDANNSGFTNFADLAAINANFVDPADDSNLFDINASGFVNFADLASANSFNGDSAQDPAPTGHSCTIP